LQSFPTISKGLGFFIRLLLGFILQLLEVWLHLVIFQGNLPSTADSDALLHRSMASAAGLKLSCYVHFTK